MAPRGLWWVADAFSAGNLLCGLCIIYVSRAHFLFHRGALPSGTEQPLDFGYCFALLSLSSAFDALDGPAARKFGGSKFGLYCDATADSVSYGIAPGVVLYYAVGGWLGVALGAVHIGCTLLRLFIFVLNEHLRSAKAKAALDAVDAGTAEPTITGPVPFHGLPSPVGAVLVMGTLHLCLCDGLRGTCLRDPLAPETIAPIAAVAAATSLFMVSFNAPYARFNGLSPASVRNALREHRTVSVLTFGLIVAIVLSSYITTTSGRAFVAFGLTTSMMYAISPHMAFVYKILLKTLDARKAVSGKPPATATKAVAAKLS